MSIWCCNYRLRGNQAIHVICLGHSWQDAQRWFNNPPADIQVVGKLWDLMQ